MTPSLLFESTVEETRVPVHAPLPGGVFMSLPESESIDWEDVYNAETETECLRFAKTTCPNCGRVCCPLLSPTLIRQGGGWRWVGLEYQEPYSTWAARCPDCHCYYRFLIYVPQ